LQENATLWKAKFSSGASAFLMLKDKKDKELRQNSKKLNSLPDSYKNYFVIERPELDAISADPNAILALAPIPGVSMSASTNGKVITSRSGGTHTVTLILSK
jgi:hypothetical protein